MPSEHSPRVRLPSEAAVESQPQGEQRRQVSRVWLMQPVAPQLPAESAAFSAESPQPRAAASRPRMLELQVSARAQRAPQPSALPASPPLEQTLVSLQQKVLEERASL